MATTPTPPAAAENIHALRIKYRRQFYRRFFKAMLFAGAVIGASLFLGILGYRFIAGFGWVDSLLNASMILSGMGPVGELKTDGAKVFASAYALFSGVVFISATGILLSPVFHRVLHRFHIEEKDLH
ncbi:MAG TPA: hypothetical protein VK815_13300 [Candidatus Acidoferrales bacterium]|jgi:hypothetical protein|nr:hypothetical protein [Candidatus Acidoferrales bacterium]